MGQDQDKHNNPFTIGDKIIIAILPHENTNKLMAKWKGPFLVTKVPNRFQIEYLEGNVTRLTHISYAKRYHERCHYAEPVGRPHPQRVSRRRARKRMARLRLVAGGGKRRIRKIVDSLKVIRERWPVRSGPVRIQVLGDRRELSLELKGVVEAADQDGWIEGSVLVDLCVQRSEVRGSGCDASGVSKELPLPTASPPSSSSQSAVQVRQYTCRPFSKERSVSDIRREYVHLNVRNDHNFSVFPRQEPHVARVSLLDVVRKVGRSERLKGKEIKETTVKDLHDNREKVMTSSCHSRQNSEYKNPSFPTLSDDRKHGDLKIDKVSSSENARYAQTQLKEKEKVGKGKCKTHGHSIRDVTISSSDVINPSKDVNKPIARKCQVRVGQSFISKAGAFECMGNIYNQTYINFSFMLVIVINVIKRMLTLNSSKQSRKTGRPSARQQECMGNNSHAAYLFQPRLLRAMETVIAGCWINSSSCIPKDISGRQKQRIARDRAVFQNTLLSSGTILTPVTPPPCCCVSRLGNVLKETFLAGKYLNPFIFLFVALYVSYSTYFITYTVNLVSDISFTAFWVLKYVYINVFYRSWPSYKWSTPLPAILYTLVNFASSPLHSVGKSHYKFPSIIINRVALWKKANVVIQYFLGHFRSCWREWRPLVTPWAWSIREGTELWRIEKWLPSSHAQHLHLAPR